MVNCGGAAKSSLSRPFSATRMKSIQIGRAATASQLLGSGVDLEAKDGPATAAA